MRIGLRLASNWQSDVFRRIMPLLEQRGCEFFEYHGTSHVDLWIIQQLCLEDAMSDGMGRLLVEIESLNAPYCLLERLDGANLTGITRRLLASESPPAYVWKNSRYADPWLYNKFSGRYHVELIKQAFGKPNWIDAKWENRPSLPMQIAFDRLGRVHAPFSFGSMVKMQAVLAYGDEGAANADRPIDVSFAGTIDYGEPEIKRHRETCISALRCLPSNFVVREEAGRNLDAGEYAQLLFNSKCVVSPCGYGETCYRDWEAIFAGCILIKPCAGHLAEFPVHIGCKADFSDLEEAVRRGIESFGGSIHHHPGRGAVRLNQQLLCSDAAVADRLWSDIQIAVGAK